MLRNSSHKNVNHPHLCFRIDLFYSFSYFSPSFTTFFFVYGVLITHKHYSRGQPLRPPLFFSPYKGSRSKAVFIQTVNGNKSYLKFANVSYTNEIKETITSQKLGSYDFWRIANRVFSKGKSASPEVFFSIPNEAKMILKMFSGSSTPDNSRDPLPFFPTYN